MNITPDKAQAVYTLAIASKLSGVPTHSIRQYIDKELILPYRTSTGRHLFTDIDVKRLTVIKKYMEEGLNIAGIKSLYAQIPGYLINACSDETCNNCGAYQSSNIPCWIINKGKMKCGNKDCRDCDVYKMADPVADLKSYLVELKRNGLKPVA